MSDCDIMPCPGCGEAIEHNPDMGAPENCQPCEIKAERQAAAIFYSRYQRALRAAEQMPAEPRLHPTVAAIAA